MPVLDPPKNFIGKLRYLGPGFILSAAIVGSGELIATTSLGAKAGFVTFWVILVSCFVKVAVQLEFGKNAIYSGAFTMENFNRMPGPKFGKAHWSIWLWLSLQGLKLLQVGGIIGGAAIVLHMMFPLLSVNTWALAAAVATSFLVYQGYYGPIEKGALIMIILFTCIVILSLVLLQYTPNALTWQDIRKGLSFQMPAYAVVFAIGAFGITGVGGDEIMYYNYWCIEKGYATYTGPDDGTAEWAERAKGWIQVMYLDAFLSMVVYTIVTAAFYLLGAALLHGGAGVPEGYDMIGTLSTIFIQTLGPWSEIVFLIGAFFVLYSTLFTATASWARLWGDAFSQLGWIKFNTRQEQMKVIGIFSWIFPVTWCLLFWFVQAPVMMVILGGVATSILLLLVVWAAYIFRYRFLPVSLKPTPVYDIFFWISIISILGISLYGLVQVMS